MIRRAVAEDVGAIGEVFLAARDRMTFLPPMSPEARPRIGELVTADQDELWVAERDGRVVGFAALRGNVLDHLYVHPQAQGAGLGSALFDHVRQRRPHGFEFWIFQKNVGARRFYERHGCRLVRATDGEGNTVRQPDALYEWRPATAQP